MKIALVSYEYPPDTSYGGISTYVYQAAHMLVKAGHLVEVFTASPTRTGSCQESGINVHRICLHRKQRLRFGNEITSTFIDRHRQIGFDIFEGPEIGAETRGIAQHLPTLPRVVKLHTPQCLINQLNQIKPTLKMRFRRNIGAFRRRQWPKPFPQPHYDREQDLERYYTLSADEITTPSKALGDLLIDRWQLPPHRVFTVPNPYVPSAELLNLPVLRSSLNSDRKVVTFVGRLEQRKGILDLALAIPQILRHFPPVTFRFVGATDLSPEPPETMQSYLERRLRSHRTSLDFTGPVSLESIPEILAKTDICVFPSHWENFPNVCLEAMAAGKAIVGSNAGGMAEMLCDGKTGILITPHQPQQIAQAVIHLLKDNSLCAQLGAAARERVCTEYNTDKISALQIASYERAIQSKQRRQSKDRCVA
ncbi:MAG: Glycosyltransferase [Phormidesmis priestleyi Ana]|uniref:Glycosyltransferase n=1 Tax=Phormidesmis priestleyi Ana TaxID=1666911 RepID=A0A0P7YS57_9CYAN|nr:MAG: Glycosyltransferase [Phormidesmis priestleyi Ana]